MNLIKHFYVRVLEVAGKAVDIWSTKPYPANVLSNLYSNAFEIDEIHCASMEGFLQSLKEKNPEIQREICNLSGKAAKEQSTSDWQISQIVYWQGHSIHRQSQEFQYLISRAYHSLFEQNETFRSALLSTEGKRLYHSRGLSDPRKTILTTQEFCRILEELRPNK